MSNEKDSLISSTLSCCCSATKLSPTLCNRYMPDSSVLHLSWSLLRFMPIELVTLSNHLILYCSLLLLPSIFPSIRVFPMNQLFASGGQTIRSSVSASDLPMNIQGWFPFGLTGLILQFKGLSRVFSVSPFNWASSVLQSSASFTFQHSYLYMTTRKKIALPIWTFVSKILSLLFNALSRFVIVFLPRSKGILISWLKSLSTMILGLKKIKFVTFFTFTPSTCHDLWS